MNLTFRFHSVKVVLIRAVKGDTSINHDNQRKMMRCRSICCGSFSKRLFSSRGAISDDFGMPPVDFKPLPYKGPSYEEILAIRSKHISPSVFTIYKKPLLIHQGHMQWLFDHRGRRYLDLFGGIVTVSVGHSHPKVNAAVKAQMDLLWHTTNIYLHPKLHEYATELTSTFPKHLSVAYITNSGSEANDLAAMMAQMHTNGHNFLTLRNSYHGGSPFSRQLINLSTWRHNTTVGSTPILQTMNADVFRGPWGGSKCRDSPVQVKDRHCNCSSPDTCCASELYAEQLEDVIKHSVPKGGLAAFYLEPIQGVGGTVQFPKGFVKKAFEIVRKHGGLCIADEVQTGFGRTGETFWGFEGHDVVPDIVTMAKGMASGFPMGAVITTPEIAASMSGARHFNTFGGNPLASTAGMATLRVMKEEDTQSNCRNVGTYFLQQLSDVQEEFPQVVGDVRGKGLMIGVELVEKSGPADRNGRKIAPLSAEKFSVVNEYCRDNGVLFGSGGLYGNVLRIKPPMCITRQDVDFVIRVLRSALHNII